MYIPEYIYIMVLITPVSRYLKGPGPRSPQKAPWVTGAAAAPKLPPAPGARCEPQGAW